MRMDRRAGLLSATNKYAWKKYALRYEPVVVYNRYGYLSLTPLSTYEKITESSTTTTTRSSAFYVGTTYSYDSSKQSGFTIDHTTSIAVSSSGASTAKNKYMGSSFKTTSGSDTYSTIYKITAATYSSSSLSLTRQRIYSVKQGYYVANEYSFNENTGYFTASKSLRLGMESDDAINVSSNRMLGTYFLGSTTTMPSTSWTSSSLYLNEIIDQYNSTGTNQYIRYYVKRWTSQVAEPKEEDFIEYVTSNSSTAYPMHGAQDGYFYSMIFDYDLSYTGNYNESYIRVNNTDYRLLELTSSGTLSTSKPITADIWVCGGGGGGQNSSDSGNGGGGAYTTTYSNATIQNIVIALGAGGTGSNSSYYSTDGNVTTISGDVSVSANGGGNGVWTYGYPNYGDGSKGYGGTGGGEGGYGEDRGTGDGLTKKPFGISALNSYCDGGGGGGYQKKNSGDKWSGGDGGTNGGSGGYTSNGSSSGGTGGGLYGGNGGSTSTAGSNATGYGSGGGGGGYYASGSATDSGNGYQGACFIRIPVQ